MELALALGDDVPDAGHPVRHQAEGQHQQREDHSRILAVPVHLLQHAQQPQQTRQLQQVDLLRVARLRSKNTNRFK